MQSALLGFKIETGCFLQSPVDLMLVRSVGSWKKPLPLFILRDWHQTLTFSTNVLERWTFSAICVTVLRIFLACHVSIIWQLVPITNTVAILCVLGSLCILYLVNHYSSCKLLDQTPFVQHGKKCHNTDIHNWLIGSNMLSGPVCNLNTSFGRIKNIKTKQIGSTYLNNINKTLSVFYI